MRKISLLGLVLIYWTPASHVQAEVSTHVWKPVELTFQAAESYANPYTDVEMWVELKGPDFDKRVYGFWDGDDTFRVRVLATEPGGWTWESGASRDDAGLRGKTGSFSARAWTEAEKTENANRHGIVRPTASGHALEYADGTPCFFLADTHWATATWRYPLAAKPQPGGGMSFEETVGLLKARGFNSIGFITCFPNWSVDAYKRDLSDKSGVQLRSAWMKPGQPEKAMDMHDEDGDLAFLRPGKSDGFQDVCADFDRLNPAYWQHLDVKMAHMWEQGFMPYMESIRRDHFPSWIAYHDFQESFPRFLNYLRARYGVYNVIFALTHLDNVPEGWRQNGNFDAIKNALTAFHEKYGTPPFGQPETVMAGYSSADYIGNPDWMTLHATGNDNRHNGSAAIMERHFALGKPCFNNEPYYTGAVNWNGPAGPQVALRSDEDNYFARAHMYCNVLSGGLAGQVYGSLAWHGAAAGEPDPEDPHYGGHYFEAFELPVHRQVHFVRDFLFSAGERWQYLEPAGEQLSPRETGDKVRYRLAGMGFMLCSPEKDLALLYFERESGRARVTGMHAGAGYEGQWFNSREGVWLEKRFTVRTDASGTLELPAFPGGEDTAKEDWGVRLERKEGGNE